MSKHNFIFHSTETIKKFPAVTLNFEQDDVKLSSLGLPDDEIVLAKPAYVDCQIDSDVIEKMNYQDYESIVHEAKKELKKELMNKIFEEEDRKLAVVGVCFLAKCEISLIGNIFRMLFHTVVLKKPIS